MAALPDGYDKPRPRHCRWCGQEMPEREVTSNAQSREEHIAALEAENAALKERVLDVEERCWGVLQENAALKERVLDVEEKCGRVLQENARLKDALAEGDDE